MKVIRFGGRRWLVLKECNGLADLLAEKAVCFRPYHDKRENIEWKDCSLRAWLNTEFIKEFNPEERKRLLYSCVQTSPDLLFHPSGTPTSDYVYIPSEEEVEKYLPDYHSRKCLIHTKKYGEAKSTDHRCEWWIRTPGNNGGRALYFDVIPTRTNNTYVDDDEIAVRPMIRIKMEEEKPDENG